MIAYFDTSALVPLIIEEPGSGTARRMWDEALRVVGIPLAYPEAQAALAQARRAGRLTARQMRDAVSRLNERFSQLDIVAIDEELARHAGALAEAHALRGYDPRGYDGVHLAAAEWLDEPDLVLVAGDRALLVAARASGMAVATVG